MHSKMQLMSLDVQLSLAYDACVIIMYYINVKLHYWCNDVLVGHAVL